MKKIYTFIFLIVTYVIVLLVPANNSISTMNVLTIQKYQGYITLGNVFTDYIVLNTEGNYINAIDVHIKYNPQFLELTDYQYTQSFCQYYIEKNVDYQNGIINLTCGVPSPGFYGKNNILILKFKPLAYGDTSINVLKTSKIMLNSPKPINMLNYFTKQKISVIISSE